MIRHLGKGRSASRARAGGACIRSISGTEAADWGWSAGIILWRSIYSIRGQPPGGGL